MSEQTIVPSDETSSTARSPGNTPSPSQDRTDNAIRPKRRRRVWIWVLGAAILIGGFILYRKHEATEEANRAKAAQVQRSIPIQTAAAYRGDIGVYVQALGAVTPVNTVTITSRVQGQIMDVYYREGQMVRKGDPLLDIDLRPYQAALTQAEGTLAHDQGLLNEAQIDKNRYQEAFDKNAIAKQQLDDQVQVVTQDEGTVKTDTGTVENARVNLLYCHITSPIDGRVGLRLVDPGNIVQSNSSTALLVITQLQPITVIFSVSEDYLPEIEQQLRKVASMSVEALDRTQAKELAKGSLLTLDNQIDPTTGTVKLKAVFPNKDSSLFPSQFVNARLLVETQHGSTLIPTAAIQRDSQNAFVYVIKQDQTASMRTITAGTVNGNVTAVKGVQPGEIVAVNGFDKLQDGIKVSVNNAKGQGGQSNTSSGDTAP